MKRLFVSYFLIFSSAIIAQIGGDATYRFLDLSSSPRQLALGNPITIRDADISTTLANPATIRGEHGGQLMINYEPYFDGIHRGSAAYALAISRERALVFDIKYIHYGTFDGADELGNPTADFSGNEVALGLASSQYFLRPNLHVGARLRYVLSNLDTYTSSGITGDIGLYYKPNWKTLPPGIGLPTYRKANYCL